MGRFSMPEFLPTLCKTSLILLTHLSDCKWEPSNKNDCKMHPPHKKCYEGNAVLIGSVRWAVMSRFKKEANKRTYPVTDLALAA